VIKYERTLPDGRVESASVRDWQLLFDEIGWQPWRVTDTEGQPIELSLAGILEVEHCDEATRTMVPELVEAVEVAVDEGIEDGAGSVEDLVDPIAPLQDQTGPAIVGRDGGIGASGEACRLEVWV